MKDLVEKLAADQQKKVASDIVETEVKILSALYDKAAAYTNVIVIGGYASFFGLWQLTKPYLSPSQARWSALIMLVSVCCFVFFEVYKMVVTTARLAGRARNLEDPRFKTDLRFALDQLREYEQAVKRDNVTFIRVWKVNVVACVFGALIAVGILCYSFILGLLAAI